MRIATLLTVPLLAALVAVPARAPAQVSVDVRFGTRLGPEIGVFAYSPQRYGDWQTTYRRWTPVTLYDVNGHYYRYQVRGARAVQVYSYNNEYFLPPQDEAWANRADPRYRYQWRPGDADYGRARPYSPEAVRIDPRLGHEVGVLGYSPDRAGDWRTNVRRWKPVTLYEFNGRYYSNNAPGARAVAMYRYQNEYFLPPTDQGWVGADKRFNYNNQPNAEDRRRVRDRP
ncbi:MAG: hypothetical protein ABSB58_01420 [Gemmatimonadales bacterium]|jgi:hypothetical protein